MPSKWRYGEVAGVWQELRADPDIRRALSDATTEGTGQFYAQDGRSAPWDLWVVGLGNAFPNAVAAAIGLDVLKSAYDSDVARMQQEEINVIGNLARAINIGRRNKAARIAADVAEQKAALDAMRPDTPTDVQTPLIAPPPEQATSFLQKRIGPLPLAAWLAIGIGAYLLTQQGGR